MEHKLTVLWAGYPVLDRLSKKELDADTRHLVKKNLRLVAGPWKDILTWIEDDRVDNGWSPRSTGLPSVDNPFWVRLTSFLDTKTFTFEPAYFLREELESLDGITVKEEEALEFLVAPEAKPEPKPEPKLKRPARRRAAR